MTIAQTRFWIDRDSRQIGIRSANRKNGTQPFELWLNKHAGWLDFKFYEDSNENDDFELRLSFCLLWISLNMSICRLSIQRENNTRSDDRNREWGWHFIDRCFVWRWNYGYHSFQLPFITTECEGSQILSISRNRVVFDEKGRRFMDSWEERQKAINDHSATFDYTYELNNGEKQHVKAKVHVTRHIRRRKWTPFITNDDGISVEFSEEVGSERGSWKGGCTGCGYNLRKKETVRACLRRMERDRRFER